MSPILIKFVQPLNMESASFILLVSQLDKSIFLIDRFLANKLAKELIWLPTDNQLESIPQSTDADSDTSENVKSIDVTLRGRDAGSVAILDLVKAKSISPSGRFPQVSHTTKLRLLVLNAETLLE